MKTRGVDAEPFQAHSRGIVGKDHCCSIEVHRRLDPGLMEWVYEQCFCHELQIRRIPFRRQAPIDLNYQGLLVEAALRPDPIVDDKIVVELNSAERHLSVFEAQLVTYLKLSEQNSWVAHPFRLARS